MKKKYVVLFLLICMVCVSACGKEKQSNSEVFNNPKKTETVSTETSESVSVVETKEETAAESQEEETEESESVTNETVETNDEDQIVKVVEDEYGIKTYYADEENYLEAYKMYLTDNMDESVFYSTEYDTEFDFVDQIPLYVPQFGLYDINDDGMKELIVSGALGLRCKMFTTVAFWNGDTFLSILYDGEPSLVGSNMLLFDDPDYGGAGEEMYIDEYIVSFDEFGNETDILSASSMEQYTETGKEDGEYVLVYENYYLDGAETSKETYSAKKEELMDLMDAVELYDITPENIEQFVK